MKPYIEKNNKKPKILRKIKLFPNICFYDTYIPNDIVIN